MSTNPNGRMMISYARKAEIDYEECSQVTEAMHEFGIPTWRDTRDFDHEPAGHELPEVLASPDTAGAVMLLSPEVEHSATIKRTEAPPILERARLERGIAGSFLLVPVAAGNLARGNVAQVLGAQKDLGLIDTHNMETLARPARAGEVQHLVGRVQRDRLRRIRAPLTMGAPLRATLDAREAPAFDSRVALALDYHHLFSQRHADEASWKQRILPALDETNAQLHEHLPQSHLTFSGQPTLSLAVAAGVAFRLPRGVTASWNQYTAGQFEEWSVNDTQTPAPFTVHTEPGAPHADDLGIFVGITNDPRGAVASTLGVPPLGPTILVAETAKGAAIRGGGQAADLAHRIARAVKDALTANPHIKHVHLFIAGPVGLAFLVGQLANTWPPIQTYEFEGGAGVPPHYVPEACIDPSARYRMPMSTGAAVPQATPDVA